jgi:hypothetical protein
MIFVFGSNISGIHGAGAARTALQNHHAIWGQGEGLQGNSYALPTKGVNISFIPLSEIVIYVNKFIEFANENPKLGFQVTRVGCGLAGFEDHEIAPMFINAPINCFFDLKWKEYLPNREYWGSF